MPQTYIFDFDGTLADTLDLFIEEYNAIAVLWRLPLITPKEKEVLRMESPHVLLKRYKIPLYTLPRLVLKLRATLQEKIDQIQIPKERVQVIRALKAGGKTLGILTSNSRENVEAILKRHGLADAFGFILTGKHVFGKDRTLKKFLKSRGVKGKDVCYIGDEIRDVEAAKKAGVISVGVTWGFNKKEALNSAKPDHLVEKPQDLCKI